MSSVIAKTSRGKVNRELIPESTVLFYECLADHIMKHAPLQLRNQADTGKSVIFP